jgi:Clathrin light chain
MSNFPSIEEFDSGHVTVTKIEDGDDVDFFDSTQTGFLAREQAILGDDANFFQSAGDITPPSQGEAAFFGGKQGICYVIYDILINR